ncbi:histidine phosphatase family protein [Paracoccus aminophilus]|uniref:Phosphoglycerate mutase n=1 Tax=Paracoccus aminophilus JCM 7686 TaxID=1367847 RepID=S5Y1V9_PARAH|nr:histidine phosphatase family protein [Paracoccus aminophilus]AGT11452.1 phosphoglycerate mutase [Paracoccus aminophilus JCM 7686]
MTIRLSLICAAPPDGTAFPADQPASRPALDKLTPLAGADLCLISPLRRARDTAQALGCQGVLVPALAETDFGAWAGRAPADLLAEAPADFAAWLGDPTAAPHGGESFAQMAARVTGWLDALTPESGELIAITHPGPIQALVLSVLDAPLSAAARVSVKPLSRTRLSHDGRRWSLHPGAALFD